MKFTSTINIAAETPVELESDIQLQCSYCGKPAPSMPRKREAIAAALVMGWRFTIDPRLAMPRLIAIENLAPGEAFCPRCLCEFI